MRETDILSASQRDVGTWSPELGDGDIMSTEIVDSMVMHPSSQKSESVKLR